MLTKQGPWALDNFLVWLSIISHHFQLYHVLSLQGLLKTQQLRWPCPTYYNKSDISGYVNNFSEDKMTHSRTESSRMAGDKQGRQNYTISTLKIINTSKARMIKKNTLCLQLLKIRSIFKKLMFIYVIMHAWVYGPHFFTSSCWTQWTMPLYLHTEWTRQAQEKPV